MNITASFLTHAPKLAVLTIVLTTSYSLVSPESQEVVLGCKVIHTLNSGDIEQKNEETANCRSFKRPLNPSSQPPPSASELDQYFYLAYAYETEGNFDEAILNYRKAAELSNCECDRLHALAGEQSAREAKEVFKKGGMAARPTQFFWGRLQELTRTLSCVKIKSA